MRICAALLLFLLLQATFFPAEISGATRPAHVQYAGGTLAGVDAKSSAALRTTDQEFLEFTAKTHALKVAYDKINLLEYGQKADRRYAMAVLISPVFLLSKKREHFLTIGYTDEDQKEQAMVLRVEKGDIRALLVSLEARTGLKVQYQDGDARKSGKG